LKYALITASVLFIAIIVTAVVTEKSAPTITRSIEPPQKIGIFPSALISTTTSASTLEKKLTSEAINEPLVNISITNAELTIEAAGYIEQVGFFKPGDTMPTAILWSHSFTPMARGKEDVIADRVFINKTYMRLVVDTYKLLEALKPGTYEVIAWSNGLEVLRAYAIVTHSGVSIIEPEVIGKPASVCDVVTACGEFRLICYINETSIKKIKAVIFGNSSIYSAVDASWLALKWIDENIVYDKEKLEKGNYDLYDPITMLRIRKGICMDYSALLATALLSVGVEPVYMISIDNINHMAPAVEINGSLFLLDQVLPPIEVGDYLDYILLGSKSTVSMLKYWVVNGEVQLEVLNNIELKNTDSYPADELGSDVFNAAIEEFMRKHPELIPDPKLEPLLGAIGSELKMYVPELVGYGSEGKYPIPVLYSPIFRKWWIKMFTDCMEQLAKKYYNSTLRSGGYFWTSLSNDRLCFIAVNYVVPNSNVSLLNDSLKVIISIDHPIFTLDVLVYRHGESVPIAGIVPRNKSYANITLINASGWAVSNTRVIFEFSVRELSKALPSGIYDLIVWINNKPAYAITMRLDRIYELSDTLSSHSNVVSNLVK